MKRLLTLLFCVFASLLFAFSAPAATVTGLVYTSFGAPYVGPINFDGLARPGFPTPAVAPSFRCYTNTTADGTFSVNLLVGTYKVSVGQPATDSFNVPVPAGNGTYNLATLATNSTPAPAPPAAPRE